ncbi:group I intron-associated PD-(D/E)XK endonuclease, partial [Escherichia coli]|uniref:group I intron-associated PD-(D/E)XK endonuclease n=1 Tax=Escherichia coli TaxID=562 RepID=UPI0024AF1D9B
MYTPQERFVSGVSSELFVAHKLTALGYEVFFPLMTQSKADFLVLKDGKVLKIQVKKASWSQAGPYQYLQSRIHGKGKR